MATWPETKTNPLARTAWEYGPMALGAPGVEITSRISGFQIVELKISDCHMATICNCLRAYCCAVPFDCAQGRALRDSINLPPTQGLRPGLIRFRRSAAGTPINMW